MAAGISQFTSSPTFSGATSAEVSAAKNNTDVIAPVFKLYIEGVQVPFESISISQVYQQLPTADIQIPPASGLMDIIRGYEPKVHIFFEDVNYGGDRLLFWGTIKATSYSRSRSAGSAAINFHCEHKNSLLNLITLDYTGWASPTNSSLTDANANQAATKLGSLNSSQMVIEALKGINGVASESERLVEGKAGVGSNPTDKLDPSLAKFEARLQGVPGVAINLWNQIKRSCLSDPVKNLVMTKMYIPLLEEALSFFKRTSGHPQVEAPLQISKKSMCHGNDPDEAKVLVPPCFRTSLSSAVQQETAVRALSNMIGFSGEFTSLGELLAYLYQTVEYDVITLASPSEIGVDPAKYIAEVNTEGVDKVSIETIIKPRMPLYYSPTCNVLLPRMYHSVNLGQDEGSLPTRLAATHDSIPGQSGGESLSVNFRSPASVREAVAYNALVEGAGSIPDLNLGSTKGYSYSIPGTYEQGTGIRPGKIALPWWLSIMASDKSASGGDLNQEEFPEKGTTDYNNAMALTLEWINRYCKDIKQDDGDLQQVINLSKKNLNPYDPLNKSVLPFERLMYATADYQYTNKIMGARSGSVEAVFNPYIIPGYPMEVIEENPNHPSLHAFCTSVTHSITSRSVSTSIGMAAVSTYAELSNYYQPPIPPYLQSVLKMINAEIDEEKYLASQQGDTSPFTITSSVLIQNPTAKFTADKFYREVLGVGAVAPDDLIHFSSGRAYPVDRKAGILVPRILAKTQSTPDIHAHPHRTRELDDYYSTVGNLRMISRPIESKDSISEKFKYNFIDLSKEMYNTAYINYVNPALTSNMFLEPGASMFLDYQLTEDFINYYKGR